MPSQMFNLFVYYCGYELISIVSSTDIVPLTMLIYSIYYVLLLLI